LSTPTIMLVDNGSSKPGSTLTLRRLAARFSELAETPVHPVSLQHADKVPAEALGGEPAAVFADFLERRLEAGEREFVVIPLFFGKSRALTGFIPQLCDDLAARFGPFRLRQGEPLCPLPEGEPLLARILADNVAEAAAGSPEPVSRVVLVDHGSPSPRVTATRQRLAEQLEPLLAPGQRLEQAVMERREGPEYDFNGPLLETLLDGLARTGGPSRVLVCPLFLAPGRHAGPGGDIETICRRVEERHSGFSTRLAPLVGAHPALPEILLERLRALP
jgi:sirohydrochlorin ferrochelatase